MLVLRHCFCVMSAFGLASCGLLGPSAAEQAQDAFAEQNYIAAHDLAAGALEGDADNPAALLVLARAHLATGAGTEALAALDRLKTLDALPDDYQLLRAEAHLQLGQAAPALALLDGLVSAESWRLRALAASLAGDQTAAQAAFIKGHEAEGDRARLFAAEATHYLQTGNRDAARAAVGRAQETAPRRVETQFVTAWLAQLDGNNEIAARAFLAILDKTPQDLPAMLGAIDALQKLDRDDLADPLITQGREEYSGDLAFVYFAARAHARKGEWAKARDLLQEHEAQLADALPAQLLYAETLLELGQGELARAIVTPLRAKYRGDEQVQEIHARALAATAR